MHQEKNKKCSKISLNLKKLHCSVTLNYLLQAKTEDIINMYNKRKSGISVEPSVKISHVLAAKSGKYSCFFLSSLQLSLKIKGVIVKCASLKSF